MSAESLAGAADGGEDLSGVGYGELSRELDEIVAFFEQREVDVDQLVTKLRRAGAIVEELDRRVRASRIQVEQLVPRLGSVGATAEIPEYEGDLLDPEDGD